MNQERFACKCCGLLPEGGMDERLLNMVEAIENEVGEVEITSGYRCEAHNAEVGGVPNSFHVQGVACDMLVPDGYTVDEFADIVKACGGDGVGRYYDDGFVHGDVRGYDAAW